MAWLIAAFCAVAVESAPHICYISQAAFSNFILLHALLFLDFLLSLAPCASGYSCSPHLGRSPSQLNAVFILSRRFRFTGIEIVPSRVA
jgi:hypothetical protein